MYSTKWRIFIEMLVGATWNLKEAKRESDGGLDVLVFVFVSLDNNCIFLDNLMMMSV